MNFEGKSRAFLESRLVEPFLHGDEKHREWLKSEVMKWETALNELLIAAYFEGYSAD